MLQRLLTRLTNRLDRLRGGSTRSPAAEASARQSADLMIAEGIRAESSGNPQEACEQYRMAVRAAPRYARAHLNLGIGLQAVGDAEGALRSYEAALALDPEDAFANYNLGNLLYARGELARAERLLRSALERKPEFPEAQVALSNVHESKGNLPAALAGLGRGLVQLRGGAEEAGQIDRRGSGAAARNRNRSQIFCGLPEFGDGPSRPVARRRGGGNPQGRPEARSRRIRSGVHGVVRAQFLGKDLRRRPFFQTRGVRCAAGKSPSFTVRAVPRFQGPGAASSHRLRFGRFLLPPGRAFRDSLARAARPVRLRGLLLLGRR